MNTEREFLTQSKKDELESEMQFLKTEKRQEILDRLAFAKSLGDLSENAEYHNSKDDQGKNEARILQIETILKNAMVVESNNDGVASLGCTVVMMHVQKSVEKTYILVGNEEADLASGKIAYTSPIGSAILDKKEGDTVFVETPRGQVEYKIISVK